MSTYYYFACDRCKEYGGFFSRQAWGWGNMDIVGTFAFLANHAEHVDHYQEGLELRVVSEHETYDMKREGWTEIVGQDHPGDLSDDQKRPDYERTTFPHSADWERKDELFARYSEKRASGSEKERS